MTARPGRALCLLVTTFVLALFVGGCPQERAWNCFDNEYPFDSFTSPPGTDELVFACKPNPIGVGIRADGTVVFLEARAIDFTLDPWAPRQTDAGADAGPPIVVPRAELEARRAEGTKEPAMPWPWDRTLRESLECFARVGTETRTVVPLTAKGRKPSATGLRLANWIRAQGARPPAKAP